MWSFFTSQSFTDANKSIRITNVNFLKNLESLATISSKVKNLKELIQMDKVIFECFPDSSVGKESACNAGDPGSVHGLERSTGEGIISYPLQYSWASLVAQLIKELFQMDKEIFRYIII